MGPGSPDRQALLDELRTTDAPQEPLARVVFQLAAAAAALAVLLGLYAWHARRTHAARVLLVAAAPLVERADPTSLRLARNRYAAASTVRAVRDTATAGLAEVSAMLWVEHGFADERDAAHAALEAVIDANVTSTSRYVAETLVALGEGRLAEARAVVDDVLGRGAVADRISWVAGLVDLAQGNPHAARDKLRRATDLRAAAPHYLRALGDALEDADESHDASQAWEQSAKTNGQYIQGVARDLFSRVRRGEGRAKAAAEITLWLAASDEQLGPRGRAALLMAQAELELQAGALVDALQSIDAAQKIDPERVRMQALAAEILLASGRTDEGLALLAKAHARAPRSARYLRALLDALLATGRAGEATQLLAREAPAHEGDAHFEVARGDVLLAEEAFEAATAAYGRALSLEVGCPEAMLGLGRIAWQQHKADAAVEWLQKAVAARARFPEVYELLGSIFVEQGALEQANKQLDMAEKLFRATDADPTRLRRFYAGVRKTLGSARNGSALAKEWTEREKTYGLGTLAPLL